MVTINGSPINADGKTVSEYLADAGYDLGQVAVERNGTIVPKAQYGKTALTAGDVIEVVNFVGGG